MKRIAIVGGGIAGLAAAYEVAQLARAGAEVEAVVYEASGRFGGVVETVREGGFTIETGPDGWVNAKPWARELAVELGLEAELIGSNDATRKTYIFLATKENPAGTLVAMPAGFQMMVPTDLDGLTESAMFSAAAVAAYRAEPGRAAELRAAAPVGDESVADFTRRHFGVEVLERVAGPLLSGVFGGDVERLSVRAVMPTFVAMEREHGALVPGLTALQGKKERAGEAIFTTLRSGMGALVDALVAAIPAEWMRRHTAVTSVERTESMAHSALPMAHGADGRARWTVESHRGADRGAATFDAVLVATGLDVTRRLVGRIDAVAAGLLPVEASSAVLVAFAYGDAARVPVPQGFGFLVPPSRGDGAAAASSLLLACTFVDQKFAGRVPEGGRLVRAFFGGAAAERIERCGNDEVAAIARGELARILGVDAAVGGPAVMPSLTVVRRWPNSLPQYAVGHLERVAELEARLRERAQGVVILGNALHGVGIPDLVRDARAAVRVVVGG